MKITLDLADYEAAINASRDAFLDSRSKGFKPIGSQRVENALSGGFLGYAAEIVFAKAFNLKWNPNIGTGVRKPDFEPNYEIKFSSDGLLHLYEKTLNTEWKYVLVTGKVELREFEILGWILGKDAKSDAFKNMCPRGGVPRYTIPVGALNKIPERK